MDFINRLLHRNEGGGVKETSKRDSLSSSFLKDTDTTADFESAGEQDLSPSTSFLSEGEETLIQQAADPLSLSILADQLNHLHLHSSQSESSFNRQSDLSNVEPDSSFFHDLSSISEGNSRFDKTSITLPTLSPSTSSENFSFLKGVQQNGSSEPETKTNSSISVCDESVVSTRLFPDVPQPVEPSLLPTDTSQSSTVSDVQQPCNSPQSPVVASQSLDSQSSDINESFRPLNFSIGINESSQSAFYPNQSVDSQLSFNAHQLTSPLQLSNNGLEPLTNTSQVSAGDLNPSTSVDVNQSLISQASTDANQSITLSQLNVNAQKSLDLTSDPHQSITSLSFTVHESLNQSQFSTDIHGNNLTFASSESPLNKSQGSSSADIVTEESQSLVENLTNGEQNCINTKYENIETSSESISAPSICLQPSINNIVNDTGVKLSDTVVDSQLDDLVTSIKDKSLVEKEIHVQSTNQNCTEDRNVSFEYDKSILHVEKSDDTGLVNETIASIKESSELSNQPSKEQSLPNENSVLKSSDGETKCNSQENSFSSNGYSCMTNSLEDSCNFNNLNIQTSRDSNRDSSISLLNLTASALNQTEQFSNISVKCESAIASENQNLQPLLNSSDSISNSDAAFPATESLLKEVNVADNCDKNNSTSAININNQNVKIKSSPNSNINPVNCAQLEKVRDCGAVFDISARCFGLEKSLFEPTKPEGGGNEMEMLTDEVGPPHNDFMLENEEPPPSLEGLSLDFIPNDPAQHEAMMKSDLSQQDSNSSEAGPITADEHIIAGEFEHPSDLDFDFLSKKGLRKRPNSNLARQSLFVKFDPLVYKQEDQDSSIMSQGDVSCDIIPSKTEEEMTPTKNQQDELLVPITPIQKPRSTPQSDASKSRTTNSVTPVRQEMLSKEISKLQDLMLQQEQSYESQLTEKVNQLAKAEETIELLNKRLEQLQSQHPKKLEQRIRSLEDTNEVLQKENTELLSSKNQFKLIIDEYEKTISQMHAKFERLKVELNCEKDALIAERDTANSHLANMEVAFNDVHLKYEKCKAAIEKFKSNELILQAGVKESAEKIQVMEERFQKLKEHATEKLDAANVELATMKKNHQTEIAKMMALVKKSELSLKSMEGTIEQKNKEIDELTKICDELIDKVENH